MANATQSLTDAISRKMARSEGAHTVAEYFRGNVSLDELLNVCGASDAETFATFKSLAVPRQERKAS